jgi:hypothetical protein
MLQSNCGYVVPEPLLPPVLVFPVPPVLVPPPVFVDPPELVLPPEETIGLDFDLLNASSTWLEWPQATTITMTNADVTAEGEKDRFMNRNSLGGSSSKRKASQT